MPTPLEDYLNYYQNLTSPGYAVLVTGEWGAGKTYQVKKALKENERYYVSLFGVSTTAEAHGEILAQMLPKQTKIENYLKNISRIGNKFGGSWGVIASTAPNLINALMKREIKNDRIIVIDDLERAFLKAKQIQGIVNTYVEHHGCSVVAICHDADMAKYFHSTKEKTIGQTIHVKPEIDEAFSRFLDMVNSENGREHLKKHKDCVIDIFKDSQSQSLRVLKHTMRNLCRFLDCLANNHINHDEAMESAIKLFCALDIEVQHNNLEEDNLKSRKDAHFVHSLRAGSGSNQKPTSKIIDSDKKYKSVDLMSAMINDDLAINMFIKGRFDKEEIRRSLNNDPHFIKMEEEPAWKTVINFFQLDSEVVQDGVQRMRRQFNGREVAIPGEMLHIFALMLFLSEIGEIDKSADEVVAESIAYIDALLSDGRLAELPKDELISEELQDSYEGRGFQTGSETNKHHLAKIRDHLIETKLKVLAAEFNKEEFLDLVRTDGNAVRELISRTDTSHNAYARFPVLHTITPQEFIDAWMCAPQDQWQDINYGLQSRYEFGTLNNNLKQECEWIKKVVDLLREYAKQKGGLAGVRVQLATPWRALESIPEEAGPENNSNGDDPEEPPDS